MRCPAGWAVVFFFERGAENVNGAYKPAEVAGEDLRQRDLPAQ